MKTLLTIAFVLFATVTIAQPVMYPPETVTMSPVQFYTWAVNYNVAQDGGYRSVQQYSRSVNPDCVYGTSTVITGEFNIGWSRDNYGSYGEQSLSVPVPSINPAYSQPVGPWKVNPYCPPRETSREDLENTKRAYDEAKGEVLTVRSTDGEGTLHIKVSP